MAQLTTATSVETFVTAVSNTLEAYGFKAVVVSSGNSVQNEYDAWETLASTGCQGYIVHANHLNQNQVKEMTRNHNNVVLTRLNNQLSGELAATHLLGLGHRQIAMVSGPQQRESVQHLSDGFTQHLRASTFHDVELRSLEAPLSEEGGATAIRVLLEDKECPTAVFFHHDRMAIGALEECQQNGVRVPHDISIMGGDNARESQHIKPILSTVKQPLSDIGTHAANLVVNLVTGVIIDSDSTEDFEWALPDLSTGQSVLDRNKAMSIGDSVDGQVSSRERECLQWAAQGKTSWEISQILGVAESTIIYHLRNATRKLNAANRLHAVAKALQASIIDL